MERVAIAEGLEFSRIVYGMWRLAGDSDRSEKAVRAKIDACLAQGITTFDQADIYGDAESEAVFGAALKADPSLRDRIEIATKSGIKLLGAKTPERRVKHYDTSAAHITAAAEHSLAKMGIERIDLLMVHRPDPLMDHEDTARALDALVDSGKVRTVGVSNFKPHDFRLLQSAMTAQIVTNQIELSVLRTDAFTNGDLAFLQERGLPVMAWSPLAGGALFAPQNGALADRLAEVAGGDVTAGALAWLLAHPAADPACRRHQQPVADCGGGKGAGGGDRPRNLVRALRAVARTRGRLMDLFRAATTNDAAGDEPRHEARPAEPPGDTRAYRDILGRFATGVTVVTCAARHGPMGMTVNSFTSLSLDPPLVMWSPAKSSHRHAHFSAAPRFAVHVLKAEQRALADAFMRSAEAFHDIAWHAAPDGLPLMEGCLARLECDVVAEHDAGDHTVMIGRVTATASGEGAPLLYFRGRYAAVA